MKASWAKIVALFDRLLLGFPEGGFTHVGNAELRINCHGDRLGGYNPPERNPVPEYERPVHPKPWSTWRHRRSGDTCTVFVVTNVGLTLRGWDTTVVYFKTRTDNNGTRDLWFSTPFTNWHRSFTLVDDEP